VLFHNLTVRETFEFAAAMRLPASVSPETKARLVEDIITELGLAKAQGTFIGNAFVRGMHVGSARTGEVMSFTPDPLGNPAPWFPLRGTTGSEGVTVGPDGTVYTSQVTPPGLVRYVPKPD
jgi:hypothetical protein